jgi:hypothetical protein
MGSSNNLEMSGLTTNKAKNKIGYRRKIRPNKAKKGHSRPQQATKGLFVENKVKNIFPPILLVPENE